MTEYNFNAFRNGDPLGGVKVIRTAENGKIPPWRGYAHFIDIAADDRRLEYGAELDLFEGHHMCKAHIDYRLGDLHELTVIRVDR